jgi:hypothetical protein
MRSPEAAAVFILFFGWYVKQQMDSAFLVFDLVGGDSGLECDRDSGCFVDPKLDDPEDAVGLIGGEKG